MGGDPFIGRNLYTLFDLPEIDRIELHVAPEIYTARDPESYRAWLRNSIRIFGSARQELIARRLTMAATHDSVIAAMEARFERTRTLAACRIRVCSWMISRSDSRRIRPCGFSYMPALKALLALNRREPERALELLRVANTA